MAHSRRVTLKVFGLFCCVLFLFSSSALAQSPPDYAQYLEGMAQQDAAPGIRLPLERLDETDALQEGRQLQAVVDAPQAGAYWLQFQYEVLGEGLVEAEAEIHINGAQSFLEMRRLVFPAMWEDRPDGALTDRLGNQHPPLQRKREGVITAYAEDSARLQPEPLRFWLQEGENTISLGFYAGSIRLHQAAFVSPRPLLDYRQYQKSHAGRADEAQGVQIRLQAERPSYKNTTMIIPGYDASFDVVPYETIVRPLNIIDEPSWFLAGDALFYEIRVPASGCYHLAVKYKQTDKPNVRVFRTVRINGQIPFAQLQGYVFDYAEDWQLHTLGDQENGPYRFYLEAGVHTLSIAVEAAPYRDVIARLKAIQRRIGEMYIDLKMVLGGEADLLRDWTLADYFPDMVSELTRMRSELAAQAEELIALNAGEVNSDQQVFITLAIRVLDGLLKRPNDIPKKADQFTEGSGSISQLIAKGITDIGMQAMTMDELYLYGGEAAPVYAKKPFSFVLGETLARFGATFRDPLAALDREQVTLEVWVERGRTQIELMQRLTDALFTANTGIVVNYRQLVDDQKLTLSAMAGNTPDAAFNVGAGIPFEYGLRGIAQDLRAFDTFGPVTARFPAGVFLALIADHGVYGLPESVDVQMTFYRHDILESLGIPVPETWDEVARIMPELQRMGMSYYTPLAGGAGTKPLSATAPFILQHGGQLYQDGGMRSALHEDSTLLGVKWMCDLSTIYGLSLQINSFFESFRSGITPIGVSGFGTYLEMRIAAPELMNAWSVAPAPGVRLPDGRITRQYTGLSTANIIFKNSPHKQEAWELLSWWSSDETQAEYARQLSLLYGPEYVFNTANTRAFSSLPIKGRDLQVMLAQRDAIQDVQYIPGWYMVEREISNVWNAVVFDRGKLRNELDLAKTSSDREILRKMEEFGYIRDGQIIRPYPLFGREDIMAWREGSP